MKVDRNSHGTLSMMTLLLDERDLPACVHEALVAYDSARGLERDLAYPDVVVACVFALDLTLDEIDALLGVGAIDDRQAQRATPRQQDMAAKHL